MRDLISIIRHYLETSPEENQCHDWLEMCSKMEENINDLFEKKNKPATIFKLTFEDGRIDYCTAKNQLHLIKAYDADFDLPLQEIESINEITEDEAKAIMITTDEIEDNDYKKVSLNVLAISNDFAIIASTEIGN